MNPKPANNLLTVALNAIASHRELIHEVYAKGRYIKNGSKSDRDAYLLHQNRVFVSDGRDSYRLSGFLTKFFDEVTQKQVLFELLGDHAGPQVNRISQLMDEYAKAVFAGMVEDADHVSAQFHDACADLADTFSSGISKLLNQAETNFAVVNSIAAKTRQNNHYLSQTKRFSDALDSLNRYGIEHQLASGYCDFEPLAHSYRALISSRKAEWHSEISRLLHFFESYLYKLRDIAPDVKRFRQFANFLQQNPGYEPPNFEQSHHRPLWMMRAPGISTVAYSDVADAAFVDYLRDIATHLPAAKEPAPLPIRESGVLSRTAGRTPPEMVCVAPQHIAIGSFARAATQSLSPLSALEWKREHCTELSIPDDVWLLLVIHSRSIRRAPYTRLRYLPVEQRGPARLSRNLFIQDVMVHGS